MDQPQPATRAPSDRSQPERRDAADPSRGAGPAPHTAASDWRELAAKVRSLRAVRAYRASSALVRWVILVVLIGVGAALLTALTVQVLVSLIPTNNG